MNCAGPCGVALSQSLESLDARLHFGEFLDGWQVTHRNSPRFVAPSTEPPDSLAAAHDKPLRRQLFEVARFQTVREPDRAPARELREQRRFHLVDADEVFPRFPAYLLPWSLPMPTSRV